jgi:hypothetical protein
MTYLCGTRTEDLTAAGTYLQNTRKESPLPFRAMGGYIEYLETWNNFAHFNPNTEDAHFMATSSAPIVALYLLWFGCSTVPNGSLGLGAILGTEYRFFAADQPSSGSHCFYLPGYSDLCELFHPGVPKTYRSDLAYYPNTYDQWALITHGNHVWIYANVWFYPIVIDDGTREKYYPGTYIHGTRKEA